MWYDATVARASARRSYEISTTKLVVVKSLRVSSLTEGPRNFKYLEAKENFFQGRREHS